MPFLAPGDLERAGLDPAGISITNPLVADESVLRTSLLPGMVKTVAYNLARRVEDVRIFEIGHVFGLPLEGQLLPNERERVAVAVTGAEAPAAVALLDEVLAALATGDATLTPEPIAGMHPTRSASVSIDGVEIGQVGEVDPQVLSDHGIDTRVAWLELDLQTVLAQPHGSPVYRPVSRFPSSDVDLAFVVPESVPAASVEQALRAAAPDELRGVRLFDVYRGQGIADGHRSLAFALRFQASDRTLTDVEVGALRQRAIDAVTGLGAQLRG
jgi:phenylalanyl-tRNA synthetase beta chain